MERLTVMSKDITTIDADAIVNAANKNMRGGGGVDGAIHAAGGPQILEDCISRFPNGLATGSAGWTTGGRLPARWVIHTVGPNYTAGERDPKLLSSCYRESLQVADELGAKSVVFPLISAGIYGWPLEDAARIAVTTLAQTDTNVKQIQIAVMDRETEALLNDILADLAP